MSQITANVNVQGPFLTNSDRLTFREKLEVNFKQCKSTVHEIE